MLERLLYMDIDLFQLNILIKLDRLYLLPQIIHIFHLILLTLFFNNLIGTIFYTILVQDLTGIDISTHRK